MILQQWLLFLLLFLLTTLDSIVQGEISIYGSEKHVQGTQIDIACRSTNGPITWLHKGTPVIPDARHSIRNLSDDGFSNQLTIFDARVNDSGLYICRHRKENAESAQLTIYVSDDSELIYTHPELTVEIINPIDRVLTVDFGALFTLKCIGYTGAQLLWYQNGSELTMTHQIVITTSRDIYEYRPISLLTRNSVDDRSAGLYECRDVMESNLGDSVTVRIHRPMNTKIPLEIIQPSSKLHRVSIGERFELKCKASIGSDLAWFYNETKRIFDRSDAVLIKDAVDRDAQLVISTIELQDVTRKDSGKYTCRNLNDLQDSDSVMITVHDKASGSDNKNGTPPMFESSVILQVGSVTNLQCSLQAQGDYRPEWTKNGRVLLPGDKYFIRQDSEVVSLSIRYTEREDVGFYRCTFKNVHNKTASVAVFNVTTVLCPPLEAPVNGHIVHCPPVPVFGESCSFVCNPGHRLSNDTPVICERSPQGEPYWSRATPDCIALPSNNNTPVTMSNVLLRIGSPLMLQCNGGSFWMKHKTMLENGAKYVIEKNSLTFKNTDRNDAGIYDCNIYNGQVLIGVNKFNVTSLACPRPTVLPHGEVKACSDQPVFGEVCVFHCQKGYMLRGSRLRSCELTGNNVPYWTGDQAECSEPPVPMVSVKNSATSSKNIPTELHILGKVVATVLLGCLHILISIALLLPLH